MRSKDTFRRYLNLHTHTWIDRWAYGIVLSLRKATQKALPSWEQKVRSQNQQRITRLTVHQVNSWLGLQLRLTRAIRPSTADYSFKPGAFFSGDVELLKALHALQAPATHHRLILVLHYIRVVRTFAVSLLLTSSQGEPNQRAREISISFDTNWEVMLAYRVWLTFVHQ